VRQALEFVAAIFRIPFVKFLGISPGGLNATGESDLRNYYDHVSAKQEKIFRKPINRLIDLMQGHLFGAIDPDIRAEFIPINDEDDAKRAATLKTKADRDAIYLDRGVLSPEEVREGLAADYDSGYSSIEPEDVPEAPAAKFGSGEGLDDMDKAGMVGDSSLASMEFEGLNAAMDSEERLHALDYALAMDEWKTIKGAHVEIGEGGEIIRGAGGKFTGQKFSEIRKDFMGAKTPVGHKGEQSTPQKAAPKIPDGHENISRPPEIRRETEKAYGIDNPDYQSALELIEWGGREELMRRGTPAQREAYQNRQSLVWIPKSRSSAHEGKIVSAEGWLAKKAGLKTNEGTAKKEAAFNAGKERYESLLEKAKAGGVKGVRVGMRASTIREKMAAAGVSE
jgi:hypothetical protein